ncbi:hypothetical protein [Microvirga sp. BSC39]|uniref:hypothetical protein n=1 Tax=Microvirga sp. BSC39 TaxID=1549810 RepID=UPI0004E92DEB|nr:hypothetical protein [Microvirga sp. BSC39]KFG67124.1 hypothetical protein JH26_23790 [Microvirga sp. BSC39]
MLDSILSPTAFFKAAQSPGNWFLSAERLRDAAEIILRDQLAEEQPYFAAVHKAGEEAQAAAIHDPSGSADAEITYLPPNYLPAQLLYAYAMENALKGLMVARNPELIVPGSISKRLQSHKLVRLAEAAQFSLAHQEKLVLLALTHIAEWAGRYPVASTVDKHAADRPLGSDPQEMLDWGSRHPIMRRCFDRMMQELEQALPRLPQRYGVVVVLDPTAE